MSQEQDRGHTAQRSRPEQYSQDLLARWQHHQQTRCQTSTLSDVAGDEHLLCADALPPQQATALASGRTRAASPSRRISKKATMKEASLLARPRLPPLSAQPDPTWQTCCPGCKGAGYVRVEVPVGHPNFGKALACSCKEAERTAKRRAQVLALSNLEAFGGKTFATFDLTWPGVLAPCKAAREYAHCPNGWMLLVGPAGTGKTHLAASIANHCVAHAEMSVLFITVPDLLDHLRATFAPSAGVFYDELFARMREVDLLILDDLGAEQRTPWAAEKLFQLLNHRYTQANLYDRQKRRRLGATVITANGERVSSCNERIRSRLSEKALVQTISFERVQDYRPKVVWKAPGEGRG